MEFELPELDKKATKEAVENALYKYRLYRFQAYVEREVGITAGYEERLHGPTNETSDQTALTAVYNADQKAYRKRYCERVERVVKHLPQKERHLIEERYMVVDAEYLTDMNVYTFKFKPPIGAKFYYKLQWKAFYKIALALDLNVTKD